MPDLKQRYILVCADCGGQWSPRFQAELTDDEKEKYPCYVCKRKRAAVSVVPVAVDSRGEIVRPKLTIKKERVKDAP